MSKEELINFWEDLGPKFSARKIIVLAAVFIFISSVIFYREFQKTATGKLIYVACNVGQGDAFYLKTPKGLDILVDGGPDASVLRCLSSNMPFWDRKIELAFLTHEHADHKTGMDIVRKRYTVERFFDNKTLVAGNKITTGDEVIISVLHPTAEFKTDDINNSSLVLKINNILLTGDTSLSNLSDPIVVGNLADVEILKVPHHGSRTALDKNVLKEMLNLNRAVISVGKNNDFGHPAPETIKMLEDFGIKIERMDKN